MLNPEAGVGDDSGPLALLSDMWRPVWVVMPRRVGTRPPRRLFDGVSIGAGSYP